LSDEGRKHYTVHDAVYGDGYIGGQDPGAYVNYLRDHGVDAIEYQAARGAQLVANAKAELALGNPVLLTIPGFWTGSYAGRDMVHYAGGTHEVVACDSGGGWRTCMNPWPSDGVHAFYQRQSDAWWAERICYGREFTCRKVVTAEQAEASQVAALQKRVAELQAQVAQLQVELKLDAPMRTLVQALKELLAAWGSVHGLCTFIAVWRRLRKYWRGCRNIRGGCRMALTWRKQQEGEVARCNNGTLPCRLLLALLALRCSCLCCC
jgi:hypothetical protein